ncbi:hypothetical protein D9613_006072 [Agrocybe pediades]|uniref:Nephrocystin 3-like N-terminal domain-containing protein n=1 Tax=Agrocybe pediades TaxID=84607 RepID=A0A8H4QU73_9AGAR|nr:hypothetical protein D9613_006072 [Agrocybe pediades]
MISCTAQQLLSLRTKGRRRRVRSCVRMECESVESMHTKRRIKSSTRDGGGTIHEIGTVTTCREQLLAMLPRSTMISSDQGILVSGGQFIQNNYHGPASLGNKAPIEILTEAVAPSAFHDSGASFDKPKCHPRTRVKILEDILYWIIRENKVAQASIQFMWLNGAAGCGKSAIAQSTIESCMERGLRLASFFFSRSDSTRNHAGSLVATLAYQLYCAIPETEVQTEILSAIKKDPLIFKKTLQQQFTALITQPLRTHFSWDQYTQCRVPFLIVIDGLDECTDRTAQKAVLLGLAESMRDSNLLVFVASRPEHEIKLSFGSKCLKDVYTSLSLDLEDGDDTDSDIRLYLFDRFAEIKDEFDSRTAGRKLDEDWPGNAIIERLVRKSSRQFIYAATVARYVESTRHRPDHRLDVVLNRRPEEGQHPFAELDSLYSMILRCALDIEKVLHVLSLLLMDSFQLSCPIIEKLLSYGEGEVETLFCDLGALVQVYKVREQIHDPANPPLYLRILHTSFREYLLDDARSKQFHIDMDHEIIKHVTHALQYLASCCTSSFHPYSDAGTPLYILDRYQYQMGRCIAQITTFPLELRQSVHFFPLKEFLEPHISTRTYPRLLEYFVSPFLQLLEAIVLNDPASSYIQDHQLKILRAALELQIQQYFNNDRQASVLVLFYHLGSHRFVPILEPPHYSYSHSTPFYLVRDYDEGDILSLSRIWDDLTSVTFKDNIFHRYVRQLLRAPGRTAKYALGLVMYERTALACFKELATTVPLLLPPSGRDNAISLVTNDAEDDIYPKLIFNSANGGRWRFKYSRGSKLENEELYFLLLGYVIFLLPRCGRSDALVTACEEHRTSYMNQSVGPFPIRRRLLHQEINEYLARV